MGVSSAHRGALTRKLVEWELTAITETTSYRKPAKDHSPNRLPRNLSPQLRKKMAWPVFLAFTKSDLETCCCVAISVLTARIAG